MEFLGVTRTVANLDESKQFYTVIFFLLGKGRRRTKGYD